jgi:hypothetical protein
MGTGARRRSWLIEPKVQQFDPLSDGLAGVTVDGKVGFIDQTGNFVIEPVFDKAGRFEPGFGRTSAERDGIVGVIDKTGAWVFRTNYQQNSLLPSVGTAPCSAGTPRGASGPRWPRGARRRL